MSYTPVRAGSHYHLKEMDSLIIYNDRSWNRWSGKGNDGFSMNLPPKNENYRRMYAYLIKTRGLSQEVVSDFVHRRLINEDSVHHNIVY